MSRIISKYRVIPLFGEDIRIQMKLKGYTAAGSL